MILWAYNLWVIAMYNTCMNIIEALNSLLWGTPTILLLVGVGIFFTIKLNFFQITHANLWIKNTIGHLFVKNNKDSLNNGQLTPLQAISTSLASTIGTGNIIGVAAALSFGGPGSIFWMWVSAIFGMMTSFSENVLGIYFRDTDNKTKSFGVIKYIESGLTENKKLKALSKPLAVLYAVFLLGASFGIGNMTQANSISESIKSTFGISTAITGVIITSLTFLVISGSIKRIGNFTEKLVPFMAAFYIITTLIVFISNFESINYVFSSIITNAFTFKSAASALSANLIKRSISTGFKRGVFSNEAGLGASVTVNSCSSVKEPCEQGMWGIFSVFTDTIIICTMTAFVLLSTSVEAYNIDYALTHPNEKIEYVYIGDENFYKSKKVFLTDTKMNNLLALSGNEKIKTNKTTYTNIMKLETTYDSFENINKFQLYEIDGASLVSAAFKAKFGSFASILLSAAIVLFSFSTIIGWSFYGIKAAEYLFPNHSIKKYKSVYCITAFIGSVLKLTLVFAVSDIFNALMALPNLFTLILLSKKVKEITKNYLSRKKGKICKAMLNYKD